MVFLLQVLDLLAFALSGSNPLVKCFPHSLADAPCCLLSEIGILMS